MHFEIEINATVQKVWDTMLADATYREWTETFHTGSYYKGDWSEGSKMLFLGPDENSNKEGGMVSRIKENRKYEFISIEHLGVVTDGVEDTTSEQVMTWLPAFENYTFTDKGGHTLLVIDMEMPETAEAKMMKEMFEGMWPKALLKLKEICER